MKEFTIEEIKEVMSEVQLKLIEKMNKRIDEAEKRAGKQDSLTKMAMSMQHMMAVVEFEQEIIKELERR